MGGVDVADEMGGGPVDAVTGDVFALRSFRVAASLRAPEACWKVAPGSNPGTSFPPENLSPGRTAENKTRGICATNLPSVICQFRGCYLSSLGDFVAKTLKTCATEQANHAVPLCMNTFGERPMTPSPETFSHRDRCLKHAEMVCQSSYVVYEKARHLVRKTSIIIEH